ncbi:hypothetical protein ABG067_009131, partial [Albugo candida]
MEFDDKFSQKLLEKMEENIAVSRQNHDREIMMVDLSTILDEGRRKYFKIQQEEILSRLEKEIEEKRKASEAALENEDH